MYKGVNDSFSFSYIKQNGMLLYIFNAKAKMNIPDLTISKTILCYLLIIYDTIISINLEL